MQIEYFDNCLLHTSYHFNMDLNSLHTHFFIVLTKQSQLFQIN